MQLYNTLTHNVEKFKPYREDYVTMYTCGPTVYNYAHIGNLRNYINSDVLQKSLEYLGYKVKRCMNITDVGHVSSDSDTGEDKMVKGAIREHKTVLDIAKFYTDKFFEDFSKLNIKRPEFVVPATTCIEQYIIMIEKLLEDGYAYISGENVYFDTSKLDDYYVLTNHNANDNRVAVRDSVEEDSNKRNKSDFVLWFTKSKFQDQELKWESPWGIGYPGWHIECSNISIKYLGEHLDIHSGGIDLVFPHHTNEIAQSEAYLGHKWCNYWVHNEYLMDKAGKMSKSKGEFLTLDVLINKGYNPLAYKLFCLQSHYRKQLLFSYESLDAAANAYNKLKNKIGKIVTDGPVDEEKKAQFIAQFKDALANDVNTAQALTILYDVIKSDVNGTTKLFLINDFDKVLSLDLTKKDSIKTDSELELYINSKIEERNVAKNSKNYELADLIRKELEDKGIMIKDTREGTTYEIK